MAQTQESFPVGESQIDWNEARAFLGRRIARKLGHVDPSILEDATQEACVRLLRALRREGAQNPEGLMTTIADRTAISIIRRLARERGTTVDIEETAGAVAEPRPLSPDILADLLDRVRFIALEFFRTREAWLCLKLAQAWFREEQWAVMADRLHMTQGAVRKRWERCRKDLLQELQGHPDLGLIYCFEVQ